MDIKKEVEKGFTCEGIRARQREVRPDASPIQPKITWGDVYEGRVKLSDIFYPWGYFPKIPKK